MAERDSLLVEEQALFERERGLVEMEAQLHEQEQGVAQIERAFKKRNRTLINLASYVSEQEAGLVRRAEAIGPQAKQLVDDLLGRGSAGKAGATAQIGLESERRALLSQRNELLELRMALIEQREATYASRHEAIERAEGATADLEQRLLEREREISEALRELITSSSSLANEEEEEDEDAEPAAAARHGPGPKLTRQPVAVIAGESVQVIAGEVDREDQVAPSGPQSRAEDEVTRRRKGRARARTNQFRITLEAQMDTDEGHGFFSYINDNPDDVPGVFIATPNLLKVGREVRVRVGFEGGQLEATGVVAWRRQRGESGGPPGMGIELLNLTDPDLSAVADWTARKPPIVV